MKNFFLAPGRLVFKLLSRDKKRAYRSPRQRSEAGLPLVLMSLICWVVLAMAGLFVLDKAGFLNQALDVGLEATQTVAEPSSPPEAPDDEPGLGSVTGSLGGDGAIQSPVQTPPASASSAVQAPDTELWLVILHTIPKSGRSEAERRQARYRSQGLEVDILDTDAFPRLKSGNWIIAQGPFDDRASALAAADRAKAFNSGLIVRRGL